MENLCQLAGRREAVTEIITSSVMEMYFPWHLAMTQIASWMLPCWNFCQLCSIDAALLVSPGQSALYLTESMINQKRLKGDIFMYTAPWQTELGERLLWNGKQRAGILSKSWIPLTSGLYWHISKEVRIGQRGSGGILAWLFNWLQAIAWG